MRQIEKQVVGAFVRGEDARRDNTVSEGGHLYLHGNEIAYRDDAGNIEISHAGWHSRTTRSRLSAVLQLAEKNARVFIKDWTMHIERDGKVEPMYERFYAV